MKHKYFYIGLIARLLIVVFITICWTYFFIVKEDYALTIVAFLLLLLAVYNLIHYFNKVNKWISFFLLGIENEDTSLKIPSKTGNKAIDDVFKGINNLNELFKQIKIQSTAQEQYYNTVISQSATGLFSVNESARITHINPAASKLIEIQEYQSINSLIKIDKSLPAFILQKEGCTPKNSAIFENKYGQKLLFKLSKLVVADEKLTLVAVNDITNELDNREVDAWVKLARTLSHEIMNNITPITTLSQVISGYFKKEKDGSFSEITEKTIENTVKGLAVIEERSSGLMNFINNYRKFTKLPEPKIKEENISELLENNLIAMMSNSGFDQIRIVKNIPENILFNTDSKLLSQVITNIIKNASEALIQNKTQEPKIEINLNEFSGTVKIDIKNNGPQIPPEIADQIFVPFFTTKEDGSGIGLSLSKQILLSMGGDILLKKTIDNSVVFSVELA
jgi:nitrogen fixation/metabolism regulation signal transduction histidine kinase